MPAGVGGGGAHENLDFLIRIKDEISSQLKKIDVNLDKTAATAERTGDRTADAFKTAAKSTKESFNEMGDDLESFGRRGSKSLEDFGKKGIEAWDVLHRTAGVTKIDFEGLQDQIQSLDQILGTHFKKTGKENEVFTKAFLQKNEQAIRGAIKDWKELGKAVPAELKKAEKALDGFEKTVQSKFMRVDDLLGKIKGLSVKSTVLGGLAVAGIAKGQEYAEEGFTAANPAAKTSMGGEKMVQGRRKDVVTLAQTTGASFDELRDINKEFAQLAYLGPKSFKDTSEAALKLSRTTTMGVGSAAALTSTLQQRFDMTKQQIEETEDSIALLSKTSGASADAIGEIYDELKFLKFGMDGNADSAGRLAKNTAEAAAEMSKYGLDSKTAINDVKSIMHGGMSEYQTNLKSLILGGATPEEATRMLDDVVNGVEGAAQKVEKLKGQAAGNLRAMGGGGALGRAMGNELVGKTLKMDSEEADKRIAMSKGMIKTSELTAEQKATANQEVLSRGQLTERTTNRGKGLGAQMAEQTYDVARSLAQTVDKQAEGLAKFSEASPLFSAAVSIFGTATNVFAAAVAVKSGIETAQGLGLLKSGGGRLLGKMGIGAAGEAVGGSGAATAATATTAVGAASFVAVAGTVLAGAAIGGVIGTLIDKATDKVPFLKKVKEGAFDRILAPFEAAGDFITGRVKASGATTEEQAKKNKTALDERRKAGTFGTATPSAGTAGAGTAGAATATAASTGGGGGVQNGPADSSGAKPGSHSKDLGGLISLADENKFRVTSTTGDAHNKGSLHYQGKAIDVSVKGKSSSDVEAFKMAANASGFKVRDERSKPSGQAVWSAPHLHVEIPGGAPTAIASAASAKPSGGSATPTGPSASADTSVASASTQGKGMTEAAAAPTVAAATPQESFTGSTDGDKAVISELRKTNAILARMAANSSPRDPRRPPNPAMTEMNQGGNG